MNYSELILSLVFALLGVYLFYLDVTSGRRIEIKDRMWNTGRILFAVCCAMSVAAMFTAGDILTVIRLICMLFCMIAFLLNRDGLSQDGFVTMGRTTPWKEIRSYDYMTDRNRFTVVFMVQTDNGRRRENSIPFELKQADEVKGFLEEKIAKKHLRMKKERV